MDDDRVRAFETALWIGGEEVYRRSIADECLMVMPQPPFVMTGAEAIEAVSNTPRWEQVELKDLKIARPQEGLIVIGYEVEASRGAESYKAACTSTYIRLGHEDWRVVQHQQTIPPVVREPSEAAQSSSAQEQSGGKPDSGSGQAMLKAQEEAAAERETERGYQ